MLRLLTTHSCVWCQPNKTLALAALDAGEQYQLALIKSDTAETDKAAQLGLGLPVLVRDDGAMSKDAKTWEGAPAEKKVKDGSKSENIAGVSSGVSTEHTNLSNQSSGHDDGGDEKSGTIR